MERREEEVERTRGCRPMLLRKKKRRKRLTFSLDATHPQSLLRGRHSNSLLRVPLRVTFFDPSLSLSLVLAEFLSAFERVFLFGPVKGRRRGGRREKKNKRISKSKETPVSDWPAATQRRAPLSRPLASPVQRVGGAPVIGTLLSSLSPHTTDQYLSLYGEVTRIEERRRRKEEEEQPIAQMHRA